MVSFIVSDQDVKNFLIVLSMNDQEGIGFVYVIDEVVFKVLILVLLKLMVLVVCGYVVYMGKLIFSVLYFEESLFVLVSYKDKMMGVYLINFLFYGFGVESGVIVGWEGVGIFKKLVDDIELCWNDNSVIVMVECYGKILLNVLWMVGELNDLLIMK